MSRSRLTSVLIAAMALVLPAALVAVPAGAAQVARHATTCPKSGLARSHARFGKIAIAVARRDGATRCGVGATKLRSNEPPYLAGSVPPLIHHLGGDVMGTSSSTNLVITPIYWLPTGTTYTFDASYKNLIQQYLTDVAHDSGKKTNVFSTLTQYSGANGTTHYKIAVGSPLTDTTPLPTLACTIDTGAIYNDLSGYSACVDDLQVRAEVAHVLTAHSLTSNLNHIYAIFLPKGVESCFYPTSGIPVGRSQQCTINPTPSAAYCAYHSAFGASNNSIYATMPFPIYQSPIGFSCAFGGSAAPQSPNNQADADTVISTLSHEVSEAISDPHLDSWFASDGNENGDLCAYIYGDVLGTTGHKYNQTINGHHYLTQEEFSNKEYVPSVAGCEQDQKVPTLTSLSRTSGSHTGGGTAMTVHGTSFRAGKTTVKFGTTKGTSVHVTSPTTLTVVAPAHPAGTVNVTVSTPDGTSPLTSSDKYTFT